MSSDRIPAVVRISSMWRPGSVLAALLLTLSCASAPVERTVLDYQRAVQDADFDALFCLSAGASESSDLGDDLAGRREAFRAWASARLDDYLVGRDRGVVPLDGEPIPLVKLFALGRGTFFEFGRPRSIGADAVELTASLRFGYGRIDLSRLSPGTTFYLSGAPAGRVHPVRVPAASREVTLEVLDRVDVVWTLVRTRGREVCPDGWAVVSAAPVEGSETTTEVTWVF